MKRALLTICFAFFAAFPTKAVLVNPRPVPDYPPAPSRQTEDITIIIVVDESQESADWLVIVVSRNRLMGVFPFRQLPTGLNEEFKDDGYLSLEAQRYLHEAGGDYDEAIELIQDEIARFVGSGGAANIRAENLSKLVNELKKDLYTQEHGTPRKLGNRGQTY